MQNDGEILVHFQEESKQRQSFAYSRSTFKELCGDLDKMGANLRLKKKENCNIKSVSSLQGKSKNKKNHHLETLLK